MSALTPEQLAELRRIANGITDPRIVTSRQTRALADGVVALLERIDALTDERDRSTAQAEAALEQLDAARAETAAAVARAEAAEANAIEVTRRAMRLDNTICWNVECEHIARALGICVNNQRELDEARAERNAAVKRAEAAEARAACVVGNKEPRERAVFCLRQNLCWHAGVDALTVACRLLAWFASGEDRIGAVEAYSTLADTPASLTTATRDVLAKLGVTRG